MEQKNNILEEMAQISATLASIGNQNVYSVPENYFDQFPDEILGKIYSEEFGKKIEIPLTVPQGFFEGFAGSILAKIKSSENFSNEIFDELETVAPLLNKISRKNVYSVPGDYFEKLVPYKLSDSAPAKVIKLHSTQRKWFKYAAAAIITGIAATTGFLFLKNNSVADPVRNGSGSYAQISTINVSQNIAQLSDADLAAYLDQSPDDDIFSTPSSIEDPGSVQDEINNSSDDEIQQYLEENKTPGDKTAKGI